MCSDLLKKIDIGFKSISILFYEPSAQKCPKLPKEYNIGPPLTLAIKSAPNMSIMRKNMAYVNPLTIPHRQTICQKTYKLTCQDLTV